MDNATKTSVSDSYSQDYNPQEQMDMLVEMFKPIKNKILCITQGNHEARTYKKEGIDIMKNVAGRLGLENRYSPEAVLLFLRFGNNNRKRRQLYTFYVTHGSGGGRKEGAKAIRLADLACIADCDIYIHSHTHLPMIFKEDYVRVSESTSSSSMVTKLFVNTSGNLKYGGYGEVIGCKPASVDKPVIHLCGDKKHATATL
jgi:predicted phosphodiesterase